MTKPFEIEELVARLKVVLKQGNMIVEDEKSIGDVLINYTKNTVSISGKSVDLSHKQYLIIEYLSKNEGYPKSKLQIMEYVW